MSFHSAKKNCKCKNRSKFCSVHNQYSSIFNANNIQKSRWERQPLALTTITAQHLTYLKQRIVDCVLNTAYLTQLFTSVSVEDTRRYQAAVPMLNHLPYCQKAKPQRHEARKDLLFSKVPTSSVFRQCYI